MERWEASEFTKSAAPTAVGFVVMGFVGFFASLSSSRSTILSPDLVRFEADMLAFSGCYYGGGEKEKFELGEIRKRWAILPHFCSKNQDLCADDERARGKCPLTPHELGLMRRALGFANNTYIYVACGEIYGGEETLRPLGELFPNFHTKEMLVNEELKPFLQFSSRLAAIDYMACEESDVFVANNNGNMAKILAGEGGTWGTRGLSGQMQRSSVHCLRQGIGWTGIHFPRR